MADGRDGAASSSSSSVGKATGSQANPATSGAAPSLLDGAFLLHLLQKTPQPARASVSTPQNHFDPAVAAVGPSHLFHPRETLRPPPPGYLSEPLLFPPPALSLPPGNFHTGFLPPRGGDVRAAAGSGNLQFFPFDHQRLGFSLGGVQPLLGSLQRNDFTQNHSQLLSDAILADHTGTARRQSVHQGPNGSSSVRAPPGFRRLPDGDATDVGTGSANRSVIDDRATRDHGKVQAERSNGFSHRNNSLGTTLQRPTMKMGQRGQTNQAYQQQGDKHFDADMAETRSQRIDDHASHPLMADAQRRAISSGNTKDYMHSLERSKQQNQTFSELTFGSFPPNYGRKDIEELDQDSKHETVEELTSMQKLEIEDNYTERKTPGEEGSLVSAEVKKMVAPTSISSSKVNHNICLYMVYHDFKLCILLSYYHKH